jgi:hypothetical protein
MSKPERTHPEWKKTIPVRIDLATLRLAESQISSCEDCASQLAEVPFDYVLDSLTGCDPETTDYILPEPALCPKCGATVKAGYWRWSTSESGERRLFLLPATLVALKPTKDGIL